MSRPGVPLRGRLIVAATAMMMAALPSTSAAFHGGQSFETSANDGGGGGLFFTSSPRFRRYDCSICHLDPPRLASLEVTSTPGDLLEQQQWTPGQSYELTVRMVGESRGLESGSNINTFNAEWVDASGKSTGTLEAVDDAVTIEDGGRVVSARGEQRVTQWKFRFVAPASGSGPIALHVAAVDGDGAGHPTERFVDTYGDDVAVFTETFCERDTTCESMDDRPPSDRAESAAIAGCSAVPDGGAAWWGRWAVVVAGLLLASRRRSRHV